MSQSGHKHALGIMIFRRDLRLEDNSALLAAMDDCHEVLPCFVFDPGQRNHPYFSRRAFDFMCASLRELSQEIAARGGRLHVLIGEPAVVLPQLAHVSRAEAVYWNRDYTPFSRERDGAVRAMLKQAGKLVYDFADTMLHEPQDVLNLSGQPYRVFGAYYRATQALPVRKVEPLGGVRWKVMSTQGLTWEEAINQLDLNPDSGHESGRKSGLSLLQSLKAFVDYAQTRDSMDGHGTTGLSAHLKFGTLSVREVLSAIARALGERHDLIRQLAWRDFFYQIAWHYPHVFKGAFHAEYDRIDWSTDERLFTAWREGQTGVPIVDAAMRELYQTGHLSGRARMIAASFLTKDLHINWQWGERYFATQLTDYDPSLNNGNWQWCASTGCDAVPYFRIMSPWRQQSRFDPEGSYIREWIPELSECPPHELSRLEAGKGWKSLYPPPIVDHRQARQTTLKMYQEARRGDELPVPVK